MNELQNPNPCIKRSADVARAEEATIRSLAKLPYALQIKGVGDAAWRTIGKGESADCLMGLVAVCDNSARRILNRNTVIAAWEAGQKAGQQ